MLSDKYLKWHLKVVTLGARLFGVAVLLVGLVAAVTAIFGSDNRLLFGVLSSICLGFGIAFLKAKAIQPKDLHMFRGGQGETKVSVVNEHKK